MKKLILLTLCALLALSLLPLPAQASIGRDILLIQRSVGAWVPTDEVVVILADGSRLFFDLGPVPWEYKEDQDNLLFYLRTHGISCNSRLYNGPAPEELSPIGQEGADQLRQLIGGLKDRPFEPEFFATDLGARLIYALRPVDGEARMLLIAERGSMVGQSEDPAAQQILALAEGWLSRVDEE